MLNVLPSVSCKQVFSPEESSAVPTGAGQYSGLVVAAAVVHA